QNDQGWIGPRLDRLVGSHRPEQRQYDPAPAPCHEQRERARVMKQGGQATEGERQERGVQGRHPQSPANGTQEPAGSPRRLGLLARGRYFVPPPSTGFALSSSGFSTLNSTRRFLAMFSGVVLGRSGLDFP